MNTANGDRDATPQLMAGLAFSGQITASVTHELNNVLGTIEQVVGLIEDLADTDAIREAGIADKLLDVAGRVVIQTDRGTALIKHLNGFAHLSDDAVTECNLAELVERMVALSARFARMRKVELEITDLERSVVIKSSPFYVAKAIFSGIRAGLAIAKPPEPVRMALAPCSAGGILTIDVRSDEESRGAVVSALADEASVTKSNYTVESIKDGLYRITVTLTGTA